MYRLDVDQSNRLDEPGDTFVAFANGISYAIRISSRTKAAGRMALRRRGVTRKLVEPLLWAACAFLLIKDHLEEIEQKVGVVLVDNEFDGHEKDVRSALLRYIRKEREQFSEDKIRIGSIGKASPAHNAAWTARRSRKAERTVTTRELLEVIGK